MSGVVLSALSQTFMHNQVGIDSSYGSPKFVSQSLGLTAACRGQLPFAILADEVVHNQTYSAKLSAANETVACCLSAIVV